MSRMYFNISSDDSDQDRRRKSSQNQYPKNDSKVTKIQETKNRRQEDDFEKNCHQPSDFISNSLMAYRKDYRKRQEQQQQQQKQQPETVSSQNSYQTEQLKVTNNGEDNEQIHKRVTDATTVISVPLTSVNFQINANGVGAATAEKQNRLTAPEQAHQYIVIGETRTFYSREGNLSQKITENIQNRKSKEPQTIAATQPSSDNLKTSVALEEGEEINDEDDAKGWKQLFEFDCGNRYFLDDQKQQRTCRRCKQAGHFERMCMMEVKNVCYYCLGPHMQAACPQRVCFNCNQIGHVNRNCPHQREQRCARCQKVGHAKVDCGAIMLGQTAATFNSRYPTIEEEWSQTDNTKIKCIDCHHKGHLKCDVPAYKKKSNNSYFEDDDVYGKKFQKRIQKLRDNEELSKISQSDRLPSKDAVPFFHSFSMTSSEPLNHSSKHQQRSSDFRYSQNTAAERKYDEEEDYVRRRNRDRERDRRDDSRDNYHYNHNYHQQSNNHSNYNNSNTHSNSRNHYQSNQQHQSRRSRSTERSKNYRKY